MKQEFIDIAVALCQNTSQGAAQYRLEGSAIECRWPQPLDEALKARVFRRGVLCQHQALGGNKHSSTTGGHVVHRAGL